MKILYLYRGNDIKDKTLWSGTISRLYNTLLKDNDIIAVSINVKLLDLLIKVTRKIMSTLHLKSEYALFYKLKGKIISKKISSIDFDYIFAPVISDVIPYLKTKKPIIYLTDATHHLMNNYYYKKNNCDFKVLDKLERQSIYKASKIITSSEWAKNDMIDYYNGDTTKIKVIPFYTEFNINNNNIKENKSVYNFLLVGVDFERKGIQKAIDMVVYLNDVLNINCYLNIVGIDNNNKYPYCKFHGYLNKNNNDDYTQIVNLYNTCDMFILPTIAECAGIVFTEACAYGLPILTHDTGGISTYVINDYNGYRLPLNCSYVDFAMKFKYMIDNDLLPKFSLNCHSIYNELFIEDHWLNQFNQFINQD